MKKTRNMIGLVISLILIVVLLHPAWLPFPAAVLESMQKDVMPHFLLRGSLPVTVSRILGVIPAILIVYAVYTLLSLILEAAGKRRGRSGTVTNLLRSILRYLAVIIAIFWSLSILGVNTAAVLASVGIIGLIVGFGAQSLIEDIITGFFIIFEGEYGVGDIIILDDFRGIVRSIGVRTTVIEDAGGNLKIVNNSDIRNLQNRSRNSSLAVSDIGVSYNTDVEHLREMLEPELNAIFEKRRDLFLSAPTYMGIESFSDSSIVLRFCVETKETDIFAARRKLNEDLYLLFKQKKIEIPFPQLVLHDNR